MKNNPETKSELTFELDEELEMLGEPNGEQYTLLIKHDYYSTDSKLGRELFVHYIDAIIESTIIDSVLLIDSGVKILNSDHFCHSALNKLLDSSMSECICDSESLTEYGIAPPLYAKPLSSVAIFKRLLNRSNIIVIE